MGRGWKSRAYDITSEVVNAIAKQIDFSADAPLVASTCQDVLRSSRARRRSFCRRRDAHAPKMTSCNL